MTDGPASTAGRAVRVWRAADLEATPWRNGGGSTYELAVEPRDASLGDFAWRISIAAVEADGPFSRYPGVDRIITLLSGGPMRLTVDGTLADLQPLRPFSFAGEADVDCVVGGASRDLNVMTRRGLVSGSLELVTPAADGSTVEGAWRAALVVVEGTIEVGPLTLEPWDGLIDETAEPLSVRGTGTVAVVRLTAVATGPSSR
ncbi:hypothetical protein acdb102_09450 [Acidothermaceae bacterium B102]|nr:hypothetical protein acdb102_09450 [Acidothermaceae bacterium B102]